MIRRGTCLIAVALALVALAPARAAAGPWTPEPGHGYLKLWLKWTCNCTGFAVEVDYPFERDWRIGATIEGGMFALSRQTGGPVVTIYVATRFSVVGEEPRQEASTDGE